MNDLIREVYSEKSFKSLVLETRCCISKKFTWKLGNAKLSIICRFDHDFRLSCVVFSHTLSGFWISKGYSSRMSHANGFTDDVLK